MSNKIKVIGQRILSIITVVVIFGLVYVGCYWLIVDDTKMDSRLTMYELYHQKNNIDALFLGSSHSMRTVNPVVADTVLGETTFNAGTSAQYLEASYALLVEAGKQNNLSDVYVELYYGQIGREVAERNNCASTYLITDYMRPSLNKIELLLSATPKEYYGETFDPVRRNKDTFFDVKKMIDIFNLKNTETYLGYGYDNNAEYLGRGFISNTSGMDDTAYIHTGAFYPIAEYTQFDVECLEKIIRYCEKRNITLHFYSAPMTDYRLNALGDYDSYINMMTMLLASYGYEYFDFNLLRYDYFSCSGENFIDDNHLNYKGATEFTEIMCRLFNGEFSKEEIFYPSYSDKIKEHPEGILGIVVCEQDTGYEIIPSIVGNMDLEYQVDFLPDRGEKRVVKVKSDDNFFEKVENGIGSYEITVYDKVGNILNHSYFVQR